MVERILIDATHQEEVRVVVADNTRLEEFDFETATKKQIKGNIYLGKITRVEPSLQAAFVEYGGNKQGFLPFSEIHYDYYHIPVADKKKLAKSMSAEVDHLEIDSEEIVEEPKEELQEPELDDSATEEVAETEGSEVDEEGLDDVGDEVEEVRSRRFDFYRKYKIQEVIKRNQIVLVQVIKEERGNKGASLTTYVSLAGRYCVLMPNTERQGGVSRRITDISARRKLKEIVSKLELQEGMSVIIRTAGVDCGDDEIKRDFDYLTTLWSDIKKRTMKSEAPSLVHEEGDLIKRSLRDMYRESVDEILVEGKDAYKAAREFMKVMAPDDIKKVSEYKNKQPIFQHYKIDAQLGDLYEPSTRLKSGGSIVITPTEALVSIDVNSGRSTRERSIEETALKTNLEAAKEIVRQLRLRDLAGLVVIDFIDMRELRNKRAVERALKDALRSDRAKIQVGRISMFGLLEMSRQRMRSSLVESSTVPCRHCAGLGMVRSDESTSVTLLRAIESEATDNELEEVRMRVSIDAAKYLLNYKRDELRSLEERLGVKIIIESDQDLRGAEYNVDKPRTWRKRGSNTRRTRTKDKPEVSEENEGKDTREESKPRGRRTRRTSAQVNGNAEEQEVETDDSIGNKIGDEKPERRGQRGGRKSTRSSTSSRSRTNRKTSDNDGERRTRTTRSRRKTDDTELEAVAAKASNDDAKADKSKLKGLWKKVSE